MTIVPIGKLSIQVPGARSENFVNELMREMRRSIIGVVEQIINASLRTEQDRFLRRGRYERRQAKYGAEETEVYCRKCRRAKREDFQRNGSYPRQLLTKWGILKISMPQLKCECGGNVRFVYQTVRPRQRIWNDLEMEILAEYRHGLSYRQIKTNLDDIVNSSLGLRTLNRRILKISQSNGEFASWEKEKVPPIVRLDGIWMTVMIKTGDKKTDEINRQRPVKQGKRVAVLAAQGVWPDTGKTQLIAWMVVDGEGTDAWQIFLETLYQTGVTPKNGLMMLVADGSKGFRAAYQNTFWQVPFQRCVFHKLRNVAKALHTPADMDNEVAHKYRIDFLRTASRIWQAEDEASARLFLAEFSNKWRSSQPKAVKTLENDFENTLSFYAVQEIAASRRQIWPAHLLRTTSHLERMFREFRRRFRNALVFHSLSGLQAVTALVAARFS